jgi:hypothetical protein
MPEFGSEEIKALAVSFAESTKPATARRWLRELSMIIQRETPPLYLLPGEIEDFSKNENPHTPEGRERIQRRVAKFVETVLESAPVSDAVLGWLLTRGVVKPTPPPVAEKEVVQQAQAEEDVPESTLEPNFEVRFSDD